MVQYRRPGNFRVENLSCVIFPRGLIFIAEHTDKRVAMHRLAPPAFSKNDMLLQLYYADWHTC